MGPVSDSRSLLANDRVAHVALRGQLQARRFVQGEWATVSHSVTELRRSPLGPRDRQLLYGTRFLVLERHGGFAFGQSAGDGYVGYVDLRALGADQTPTHWLSVPASHLYTAPNIKAPEAMPLSLGARLTVVADIDDRFVQTAHGFFALRGHLSAIGQWADDPVAVAMGFLGTPYLWGGNSRAGIDCSGLVQAALLACGISCPGDSDQQCASLGENLPQTATLQRGDLLFWPGHVAMVCNARSLIHATAHVMAVCQEEIATVLARINTPLIGRKRIAPPSATSRANT